MLKFWQCFIKKFDKLIENYVLEKSQKLLEETVLNVKILAVFNGPKRKNEVQQTLSKISDSISSYISLKTLVSLLTGGLSYIILAIIGIDFQLHAGTIARHAGKRGTAHDL